MKWIADIFIPSCVEKMAKWHGKRGPEEIPVLQLASAAMRRAPREIVGLTAFALGQTISVLVLKLHAERFATEGFIIDACLAHEVSHVVLNSLFVTDADFSERCSAPTMTLRL